MTQNNKPQPKPGSEETPRLSEGLRNDYLTYLRSKA